MIRQLRVISAAAVVIVGLSGTAHAAVPAQHSKLWLVKAQDLAGFGMKYRDLFRWVACLQPADSCPLTEIRTVTSLTVLENDIRLGVIRKGQWVLFDTETWESTPTWEQADQELYNQEAGQFARAHGVNIIASPGNPSPKIKLALDVAAAPYVNVVEIQSQPFDRSPSAFTAYVRTVVRAIRRVAPHVQIMAGLASDAWGKPATVADMVTEYEDTSSLVSGFWLNAAAWAPPQGIGCAPTGCANRVQRFIRAVT